MIDNISAVNSVRQTESVKRSEQRSSQEPEAVRDNRDVYVPSEEDEPIGLYSAPTEPRDSDDNSPEADTITGNTDKVDREIKALREKAKSLEKELRSADEGEAELLRRELERVSFELAQKDNEQYRRDNTVFT